MRKVRFICRKCGNKFEALIFEPGESEEKKIPSGPVKCPKCNNTLVERN
jgi:DNA-directed RNA polymerase subunit RPC12/RpoP